MTWTYRICENLCYAPALPRRLHAARPQYRHRLVGQHGSDGMEHEPRLQPQSTATRERLERVRARINAQLRLRGLSALNASRRHVTEQRYVSGQRYEIQTGVDKHGSRYKTDDRAGFQCWYSWECAQAWTDHNWRSVQQGRAVHSAQCSGISSTTHFLKIRPSTMYFSRQIIIKLTQV